MKRETPTEVTLNNAIHTQQTLLFLQGLERGPLFGKTEYNKSCKQT